MAIAATIGTMIKRLFAKTEETHSNVKIKNGMPEPKLSFLRMDQSSMKAMEHLKAQLSENKDTRSLTALCIAMEHLDSTFGTFTKIIKSIVNFIAGSRQAELEQALKKASNDYPRIVDSFGSLRSKLHAMKNRMKEVNDLYYEAPLAVCVDHADEIISQFKYDKLVFQEYALGSAPLVITFCKRYKRMAELHLRHMSGVKYEVARKRIHLQINNLKSILDKYEDQCIKGRLDGIDMRLEFDPHGDPEHWTRPTGWTFTYHLTDFYANIREASDTKFLIEEYETQVAAKYQTCFQQLKHNLEINGLN